MFRRALQNAEKWLNQPDRKPLIIRGARQVGKTWLARMLAENTGKQLIEFNFERIPKLASLFEQNDPQRTLQKIEAHLRTSIEPSKTLLFLDEIQAAPELIAKLRWFAEEMPEMAVVATGSLLEFVLEEHEFSMPVGRINYLYLEPLSFEEFLIADGSEKLVEVLSAYQLSESMPEILHENLMEKLKEFFFVGGLPAAVNKWNDSRSMEAVSQVHQDLLATYRDDFNKYGKKTDVKYLDDVLTAAPRMLGEKCVFSRLNPVAGTVPMKSAVSLLSKAKLVHPIQATAANGVPLRAEINEKIFKLLFIDIGLANSQLGFNLHHWIATPNVELTNSGGVSEQLVGQLLRTVEPFYVSPQLYYWVNQNKGSEAELDYIYAHQHQVIPIEVKAGKTGSLKSLHQFMAKKQYELAVRVNADMPSLVAVDVKTNTGEPAQYKLISIPFYLLEQLPRLLME